METNSISLSNIYSAGGFLDKSQQFFNAQSALADHLGVIIQADPVGCLCALNVAVLSARSSPAGSCRGI